MVDRPLIKMPGFTAVAELDVSGTRVDDDGLDREFGRVKAVRIDRDAEAEGTFTLHAGPHTMSSTPASGTVRVVLPGQGLKFGNLPAEKINLRHTWSRT